MPAAAPALPHPNPLLVGLISDTHGLLRPQALEMLQGSAHIIHAGDIGNRTGHHAGILETLARIAPVTAVRGNNDRADWAGALSASALLTFGGLRIHVLHILGELALDPVAAGIRVVVSGHSHRPEIETRAGVLYVNPGSAGPRRFKLPVSLARLWVSGESVRAELIELDL